MKSKGSSSSSMSQGTSNTKERSKYMAEFGEEAEAAEEEE
jgi:hypothetical protein